MGDIKNFIKQYRGAIIGIIIAILILITNLQKLIIGIILIHKNSPADTAKKPIVSPKRRLVYKIISTIVASIFVVCSIITITDKQTLMR